MGARQRKSAQRKLDAEHEAAGLTYCGGKKRNGEACKRPPGWGTSHQGSGRCKFHGGSTPNGQVAAARKETEGMANPISVTPGQAMAGVLHLSAGQLSYVTAKVAALKEDEIITEIGLNPWIRLQRSIMHDTAKFAKMAADAGIDERLASLAEMQTMMVAQLIEKVAEELELTREQKQLLGPAVRRNLTVLEGSAIDANAA